MWSESPSNVAVTPASLAQVGGAKVAESFATEWLPVGLFAAYAEPFGGGMQAACGTPVSARSLNHTLPILFRYMAYRAIYLTGFRTANAWDANCQP